MTDDGGWAPPDRPEPGRGTPSYAADWPAPPAGRMPLPPPPARPGPPPAPPARPGPLPPARITLPPHLKPPPSPAPAHPALRQPGGLFPAGPPRPVYREPVPVRGGALAIGLGSAALWMLLFGLLARSARGYAWYTFGAGAAAWVTALVLSRFGDRGVAVGVAIGSAVGVMIAGIVVTVRWAGGHWLLW